MDPQHRRRAIIVATAITLVCSLLLIRPSLSGEKQEVVQATTAPTVETSTPQVTDDLEELKTVVASYLEARWSFVCTDTVGARKQRLLATGVIADPAMLDGLVLEVGTTVREQECVAQAGSVEAVAYPDRLTPGHFEPDHADITMEVSFRMKSPDGSTLHGPNSATRTVFCEKIDGHWLVTGET